MVSRLLNGIKWRADLFSKKLFLYRTFRNGSQLVSEYTRRVPSAQAVLWNKQTISHPPDRMGLTVTLLEIWKSQVYTRNFYTPQPGAIIIDAGANIGIFSLWLAQKYPSCKIYAFEPFHENIEYLKKNIESFQSSQIELIPAGIAGKSGWATFSDDENRRSVDHRLSMEASVPSDTSNSIQTYSMADIFEKIQASEIDLFKIDIEGSEFAFFESLQQDDIRRVKKFAIEYHDNIKPGTKDLILGKLQGTHATRIEVDPGDDYGMIYATRK